ncbi:MAG: hypothetical protein QXI11_07475 [Thermoproteota archaeon]
MGADEVDKPRRRLRINLREHRFPSRHLNEVTKRVALAFLKKDVSLILLKLAESFE